MTSTVNMSIQTKKLMKILSPLGIREEQNAVKVAVAHLTTYADGPEGSRHLVLGSEVAIARPGKPGAVSNRRIRLLISDYGARRNVEVLVETGKVVESGLLSYQPAFHPDEVAKAKELAEGDPSVARLIKRRGLVVDVASPEKPSRSRVISVRYAIAPQGKPASFLVTVAVDLWASKVIGVKEGGPIKSSGENHG